MEKAYDVAVIGLGAMGSAALYQLSKYNLRVIGIDTYDPPHTFGSSHGETRITRQAYGKGSAYVPLVRRANEIWSELEGQTNDQLYNHCGALLVAQASSAAYRATVATAQQFDIPHITLNRAEIEKKFPAIKAEQGEVAYFEPNAGFLSPEKCISAQLQLALHGQAELKTQKKVTRLEETNNGIDITLENNELLRANQAIVASGRWLHPFLPDYLKKLFTIVPQTVYWFGINSAYYEDLTPNKLPVMLFDMYHQAATPVYGFPAIDGPEGGLKIAADHKSQHTFEDVAHFYGNISKHLRHIEPTLVKSIECAYTVTPDQHFVIDWMPDSKRVLIASPCSGHGFKYSAAIGEILADLVVKGSTALDISPFRLGRF